MRPRSCGTLARTVGENAVDLVPQDLADDGLVLARICRAFMDRLADVDAVVQQLVDVAFVDQLSLPVMPSTRSARTSAVAEPTLMNRSKIILPVGEELRNIP